jgi:hypothetical protein
MRAQDRRPVCVSYDMDIEKTTFGYNPGRLAKLLRIGQETADVPVAPSDARRRSLLDAWLDGEDLLGDPALGVARSAVDSCGPAIRSLKELLLGTNTGIETLMIIKDVYKSRAARPEDAVETDVATVIYYAAIAAGLVVHRQMMTSHSLESLREAFVRLGREPWVRSELTALFSAAGAVCQQQLARDADL